MRYRRELLLALAGCVVAGALVIVGAGRDWHVTTLANGSTTAAKGHDLVGSLTTWGLVALAGVVAVAATKRWGRIPVGIALAAAGAAVAALSAAQVSPVQPRTLVTPGNATVAGRLPQRVEATPWPAVTAAAGMLLAVSGLLVAARGPRWAALGVRYDAPAARPPTDADAWDALDRGEDPTA